MRVLGLEAGYPLVPLIAYTPYVLPVAVLGCAVAAVLRRFGAMAVAGVAALVILLAVMPRAIGSASGESGPLIQVLSANLKFGGADPRELVELVRAKGAHVLTVQELTPEATRDLDEAGLSSVLPYSALDASKGASGSGIYARAPLERIGAGDGPFAQTRVMVRLKNGAELDITSVHPVPPTSSGAVTDWNRALESLPDTSDDDGRTTVLAGDFNATLDHAEFRAVLDRGYIDAGDDAGKGLGATWPAVVESFPYLPVTIDHVVVEEGIDITDYEARELEGSDHRVVAAELLVPD